ncbi:MAG TPA: aminotransferase class V-fold PLP-dependent enzyme [Thermoanaerobaculia bacterium]|nr:aminotransferase class V-fold PLP-dependent enzyme [Thermoanaerobaculia bacterium]
MALDRRRFLSGLTAAAAGGALLPFRGVNAAGAALVSPGGEVDWRAVRAEFDLDPRWIHLSSFFLVSHPRPVREAIERWRFKIDRNPLDLEEMLFAPGHEHPLEDSKAALAEYLGGRPEEIALTPNTTTGLALVYHGLALGRGDEILTTEHDHYSHHESIRLAAEKSGAAVRFVALHDGSARADESEMAARLRRAITPRTRAVGLTWVHSSTGLKLPIPALAEAVRDANRGRVEAERCVLVVDGVHGFGAAAEEAAGLGADFFVAGTHKWLFGPRGTGLIWARRDNWRRLRPTIPTFDSTVPYGAWMRRQPPPPTEASFVSPGGFVAYEHFFGLVEAVRFHHRLGRDRVAARIAELNGHLRRELARMPRVRLHTPLDPRLAAGIVCFEIEGLDPDAAVERLRARRILATSSPYAVSYVRLAAGIMNAPEEVEEALRAVRAVAARSA